jgi:hypothetical protein
MMLRTLVSGTALVLSASAYAGDNDQALTSVSLDDLRAKCTEFTSNPQMKQVNVRLICGESQFFWAPHKPSSGVLKNTRNLSVGLNMKNYEVRDASFPATIADTTVQCQQFIKMERKIHGIEVDLTCEELLDIKDLAAHCDPIVQDRIAKDPTLIDESPTSEILNFCPNAN